MRSKRKRVHATNCVCHKKVLKRMRMLRIENQFAGPAYIATVAFRFCSNSSFVPYTQCIRVPWRFGFYVYGVHSVSVCCTLSVFPQQSRYNLQWFDTRLSCLRMQHFPFEPLATHLSVWSGLLQRILSEIMMRWVKIWCALNARSYDSRGSLQHIFRTFFDWIFRVCLW